MRKKYPANGWNQTEFTPPSSWRRLWAEARGLGINPVHTPKIRIPAFIVAALNTAPAHRLTEQQNYINDVFRKLEPVRRL